jgi:uncharacterized protein DUF4396
LPLRGTGCAIGELLGLVIATALDWGNVASIAIAVVLAFFFGYLLTLGPLLRGGLRAQALVSVQTEMDGSPVYAGLPFCRGGRTRTCNPRFWSRVA